MPCQSQSKIYLPRKGRAKTKTLKIIIANILCLALIAGGIYLVKLFPKLFPWVIPEPKIITVTKTEPGQIIYKPGPQPTPIIVEKIVIKDNKVSFKMDLPYKDKTIATNSVDMTFNGIYHVAMIDNNLAVTDEIIGDVTTTIRSRPPPRLAIYAGLKTNLFELTGYGGISYDYLSNGNLTGSINLEQDKTTWLKTQLNIKL